MSARTLEERAHGRFVGAGVTQVGQRFRFDGKQQAPCERHPLHDEARGNFACDSLEIAHCAGKFGRVHPVFIEVHC